MPVNISVVITLMLHLEHYLLHAIEIFTANQSIISNIEDTFLFDINWIGTTANVSLTGDYVCTVNFMLINPYITTVNVSFTDAATTEESEKDELEWWHTFLIVASVVCVTVAVGILGSVIYKKKTSKKAKTSDNYVTGAELKEITDNNHDRIDDNISEEQQITLISPEPVDNSNPEEQQITLISREPVDNSNPEEQQITPISLEPVDNSNPEEQQIKPISPEPIDNKLQEPKPEPEIEMNHVYRKDDDTKQPLIEGAISETAISLSASKAKTTYKKVTNEELAAITSKSTPPIDDSNSEEERKSKTAGNTVINEERALMTPNRLEPIDDNNSDEQRNF